MDVVQSPQILSKASDDTRMADHAVCRHMATETAQMVAARLNTAAERGDSCGAQFWVPDPEPHRLWRLVRVVGPGSSPGMVLVEDDGHSDIREVALTVAHPHDPTHDRDLDDVCEMGDLHQAPLLAMLNRRWRADTIYTAAGKVLISINPYRDVTDCSDHTHHAPHLFAWASAAHDALRRDGINQAIVVNGESGAGKTMASTMIVDYLANLSARCVEPLTRALVATTPVLEAFGNAKTAMNNNSSRFGKYVLLDYDDDAMVGAHLEDFLLEKARVTTCAAHERNFHFFYQLCADTLFQRYGVSSTPRQHAYLNQHDVTIDGVDDAAELRVTCNALSTLGLKLELLNRVSAACLRLGDLVFEDDFAECGEEQASVIDSGPLEDVAHALAIDRAELEHSLRHRVISVAGEKKLIAYTALQAETVRDALAKALYERLFGYVVARCNEALVAAAGTASPRSSMPVMRSPVVERKMRHCVDDSDEGASSVEFENRCLSIGILDIYGFEILSENSLDQLLINYANEMLQVAFNHEVLIAETRRYETDGVEWKGVELLDSTACIDLVQGILVQLDEQVKLGQRGSDLNFLGCIDKVYCDKHASYAKPRFGASEAFICRHYAGDVTYTVHGFLKRNIDPLSTDLAALMRSSKDNVIASWYPPPPPGESGRQFQRRILGESTSKKFREQMTALTQELAECAKHYVRCVRPNAIKSPDLFDADLVLRQLRFFGILDIVRIRRLGFPERADLQPFWDSYWRLVPTAPTDHRWHAFEHLLPPNIVAIGLHGAYLEALPDKEWRAWHSAREPGLRRIEELEEARTHCARLNETAKVDSLAAEIDRLKLDLHRIPPPDITKAVVLLCSILLEPDEYALGKTSGQLYTKLGVTQRLDEMLAKAMGVEISLAKKRHAQLSELAKERVNAETSATLLVQKAARARLALRAYRKEKHAAGKLADSVRVFLAKKHVHRLETRRRDEYAKRLARAQAHIGDLTRRHVKACEFADACELVNADLMCMLQAAMSAVTAASAKLEEQTSQNKHDAGGLEAKRAAIHAVEAASEVAAQKVGDAEQTVLEGALALQRKWLGDMQNKFDRATERSELAEASATGLSCTAAELIESVRHRIVKQRTPVLSTELEMAAAALARYEAAVAETYGGFLSGKLRNLERRHTAVVAESSKSQHEPQQVVEAIQRAERNIGDARRCVDSFLSCVTLGGVHRARDIYLGEADVLDTAEQMIVAVVEPAVREEEELFEATAKTRALADLAECRRRRATLLARARNAQGGGVDCCPEVIEALCKLDATLAREDEQTSAAATVLSDVARTARQDSEVLSAAVDQCLVASRAAIKMAATMRATKARKTYLAHVKAAIKLEAAARFMANFRSMRRKRDKAVVLETLVRGFEARRRFAMRLEARRNKAAVSMQAWWRSVSDSWCMRFVRKLTRPWQAVLPSRREYVVVSTVVVWHRYSQVGRVGEIVGSRKVHLIVTSRGNVVFSSGGVSVYAPDATPSLVRVLDCAKGRLSVVLPKPSTPAQPPPGREVPLSVVDADKPPRAVPPCKFELKFKRGLRTSSMTLTDLAGTVQRWTQLKELFEADDGSGGFKTLSPKHVVRLNLRLSIANLPIHCYGRLYKQPFKRHVFKAETPRRELEASHSREKLSDLPSPISRMRQDNTDQSNTFKGKVTKVSVTVQSAGGGKHEEKERLFILQGGVLRYYKHEADDCPKGQLCLPALAGVPSQTTIEVCHDPRFQFNVKTHLFPKGITIRAHDSQEFHSWIDAINASVTNGLSRVS